MATPCFQRFFKKTVVSSCFEGPQSIVVINMSEKSNGISSSTHRIIIYLITMLAKKKEKRPFCVDPDDPVTIL